MARWPVAALTLKHVRPFLTTRRRSPGPKTSRFKFGHRPQLPFTFAASSGVQGSVIVDVRMGISMLHQTRSPRKGRVLPHPAILGCRMFCSHGVEQAMLGRRGDWAHPTHAVLFVDCFSVLAGHARCAPCHAGAGLSRRPLSRPGFCSSFCLGWGHKRGSAALPKPSKHQNLSLATTTSPPRPPLALSPAPAPPDRHWLQQRVLSSRPIIDVGVKTQRAMDRNRRC